MKITTTKVETVIEADARELRESNSLADNLSRMLARALQSQELLDEEDDEDEDEEREWMEDRD